MRYEVVTPVYNRADQFAVEDYVFVDTDNEEDALDLAIPMLKDQYPNGYYATVQPQDERAGLRLYWQAGHTNVEPVIQENTNVTPPSPVPNKQG